MKSTIKCFEKEGCTHHPGTNLLALALILIAYQNDYQTNVEIQKSLRELEKKSIKKDARLYLFEELHLIHMCLRADTTIRTS